MKLEVKAPLGGPRGGQVGCGRAGRQGFPGAGQWSMHPQKQLTISSLQNQECRFAFPIQTEARIDPDLSSHPGSKTQIVAYGLTKAVFFQSI